MNYEKEYKAALERASKLQETCDSNTIIGWMEYIFPELTESEDEKIRKELIDYFEKYKERGIKAFYGIPTNDILAWLEKQVKQLPVDKVEPKFKVGDWVIDKQDIVHQIANVTEIVTYHTYGYDIVGGGYFNDTTEGVRLWTIQDTKDGDVLYSLDSNRPFIYKVRNDYEQAVAYCGLNIYGKFFVWNTKDCVITLSNYVPATKEQRDLLFQEMKEAGYKWDSEKKELKKIEKNDCESDNLIEESHQQQADYLIDMVTDHTQQKPTWSEADEIGLGDALWAIEQARTIAKDENDMGNLWYAEHFLKNLKDRYTWSEEDCNQIETIACHLDNIGNGAMAKSLLNIMDKYKSYRPNNTWKPSDEQMNALAEALSLAKNCGEEWSFDIRTLYDQLKKLRKE